MKKHALVAESPKMLTLVVNDKAAMSAVYMPFLKNGGMFIPTSHSYKLNDEVFILLNLLDAPEKILAKGHVAWINPKDSHGRKKGVGVHFDESENSRALRRKIEENMGSAAKTVRTYTM